MIQDFIKSLGWKDLIFIVVVVFLLYRMRTMEKMTDAANPVSAENLVAIRNLGNLAKTIMPDANSNKLVFPGDVEIIGQVTCNGLESIDRDIKTPKVILGKGNGDGGVVALKNSNGNLVYWTPEHIDTDRITTDLISQRKIGKDINVSGNLISNGNLISTGTIKGKIEGIGEEASLPGFRFAIEGKDAYIQTNQSDGIVFSKISSTDQIKIRANNLGLVGKGWVVERGSWDNHYSWAR